MEMIHLHVKIFLAYKYELVYSNFVCSDYYLLVKVHTMSKCFGVKQITCPPQHCFKCNFNCIYFYVFKRDKNVNEIVKYTVKCVSIVRNNCIP